MNHPWNLKWENVPQSTGSGNDSELIQRAKIPGGWLVRHAGGNAIESNGRIETSQGWGIFQWAICFVPDLSIPSEPAS